MIKYEFIKKRGMYMSKEQVVDMFFTVLDMYKSNMYTQKDIAEKFSIPLVAVAFCTRHAGYWHTKAKQGVKGVYYTDAPMFDEFERLLNG